MLIRTSDNFDSLINTNYIETVDAIDDKTIQITMTNGKQYVVVAPNGVQQAMVSLMDRDQHPPVVYKVQIVDK